MTPEEFAAEMREACEHYKDDRECRHVAMDRIMTNLLRQLGYGKGIDIFANTRKWYA